jgi:DNA-binding CsgD family transcriptional regulator
LVGRSGELSVLDELADGLARGVGRLLWIEGEPGIGKSSLVDALVAGAEARGRPVLCGAAEELFQPFPLRVMARCLDVGAGSPDPLRVEIADLMGGRRSCGVLDPVLAASERMLELVDRVCATGPLLLVVEDLHWADEASLAVWDRLGRAVDQMPLLLVGTCRPAPRRAETERLRELVRSGPAVVLTPGPLDAAAVAELACRLTGAVTVDPLLVAELAQAGGNPLYLRELIAGWQERGSVPAADAGQAVDTGRPASLTAAIGSRLGALTPQTRRVLRLAAMLRAQFDVRDLATATGRPAVELLTAVEEAVAAGTLVEVGERLTFRHELIRQVLYEETAAPLRVALHAQFARALARAGADVDAVARHLLAGTRTVDRWAAVWLAELPESVLFAVPEVAAELLSRVVDAPAAAGEWWGVLAARLATVCFMLDRNQQADEVAAEVVRTVADADLRGRMLWCRMRVASRQGRSEQALAVASTAWHDESLPTVWSVRVRAWAALVLATEDRLAQAREQAERVVAEAARIGDAVGAGHARLALSQLSAGTDALAYLEAGLVGLGMDADAMDVRLLLLNNKLGLLNNLGRRAEFQATVSETLILADRVGAARKLKATAAIGAFDFGAWDDALVYLESIQPPQPRWITMVVAGVGALIAGHREDWPRLRDLVAVGSAIPVTARDVRVFSGYLSAARAVRAEADGELDLAIGELSGWLDPDLGFGARWRYLWLPELVRLALAAGDSGTAWTAVEAAEADAAGPDPLHRQRAVAQFCRAQLADDVPTLLDVAAVGQRHGWPLLQAPALEEAAVRLAAGGDTAAARSALTDAVRSYADLGAQWDIRRADARLRAHGIRRGPRSLHRRQATGWDALTPAEQRVATLVADGRSNTDIAAELYISRRTAQTHVSRVLRKLALSSRTELIRAVASGGLADDRGPGSR